jgi:murein L,D-transpeptidase YcbB/YkuD
MAFSVRKLLLAGGIALALPAALAAQEVAPAAVPVANDATILAPVSTPFNAGLQTVPTPVIQPIPGLTGAGGEVLGDVQKWTEIDARALHIVLSNIALEGLDPADYDLPALMAAIEAGPGPELDAVASRAFRFLVEDLRDGRTPMEARMQWFVVDPDRDRFPAAGLMAEALASHDVAGVIDKLTPRHPDYLVLRDALAVAMANEDKRQVALIRANMDRWRWLARDLGSQYLITNVPEYQLRLTVKDQIIRTYKTIVGKPGRNATPQLAEIVEGVVFNPTWTVPQSIVKGEGLGAKVLANPKWAKANGYAATKGANGYVSVVQQPGPGNSLGLMKLDMPNPHAIFLHDTPSRHLFGQEKRALSHGCIRTERALELALTMAILGGTDKDEAVAISTSGEYTRVPLEKSFRVYITYFTMGRDIEGNLQTFDDIYGRDAPVLASFSAPRVADRARVTSEEAVEIIDDLQDS